LQIVSATWQNAVEGQVTCVKASFSVGGDALLESGWLFGTSPSAELNGKPLPLVTTTAPGEEATQLKGMELSAVRTLRVCVVGTGSGNEIGLRIRYPEPN
jgi:hypothetical protein